MLELFEALRAGQMTEDEVLAQLLVEAMKRRSHNALVEALWAWLRRNLVSMSCQTHRKDFAHARAEWTIRRAKAIDKRAPLHHAEACPKASEEDVSESESSGQGQGGG